MTLPFRRRHHDDEAAHDRARSLVSASFLEPLAAADATWLDGHLERCPECRTERDGLVADRALLRALRDRMPQPPRDLWARTAAAIEREAPSRRARRPSLRLQLGRPALRWVPVGPLAGALVVLVVVATALLPQGIPIGPSQSSSASQAARSSTLPGPTPILPQADRVAWIQASEDGRYALVFANVDHACPTADVACPPLADSSPSPLDLAAPPQAVVLSPTNDQIAVVGSAGEPDAGVVIVTVPTPAPVATPAPETTPTPVPPTAPVPPTPTLPSAVPPPPTASATPSAEPSATAPATPPASASPATPVPTPPSSGQVESLPPASGSPEPGQGQVIARGVLVVGTAAYSADGQWLAFSAAPRGGEGVPDLYVWHVGDAEARRISEGTPTYFAGWYGERILASGIREASDASPAPDAAAASGASPGLDESAAPGPLPSASPSEPQSSREAHPVSFLVDPLTGDRQELVLPDIWMPSVDPSGRFVTYWSGTVMPTDGLAWRPASGQLVLDGWSAPLAPSPSPAETNEPVGPSASPDAASIPPDAGSPSADPASASGDPASPAPVVGPAGSPMVLAAAPIADFDARFDPTGTRLAVWVLDTPEASAGRLWLVVLDPETGRADGHGSPMAAPGIQALRGFSIQTGRLGWITPAGQDGQPSRVQVLAWKGDDFGQVQGQGQVEGVPGRNLHIVQ